MASMKRIYGEMLEMAERLEDEGLYVDRTLITELQRELGIDRPEEQAIAILDMKG